MKCSGEKVILRGIVHVVQYISFSSTFLVISHTFGLFFEQCVKEALRLYGVIEALHHPLWCEGGIASLFMVLRRPCTTLYSVKKVLHSALLFMGGKRPCTTLYGMKEALHHTLWCLKRTCTTLHIYILCERWLAQICPLFYFEQCSLLQPMFHVSVSIERSVPQISVQLILYSITTVSWPFPSCQPCYLFVCVVYSFYTP